MNKISGLMDRVERVKLVRSYEPDEDPLSRSIREFFEGLTALDEQGKTSLLEKWNADGDFNITPENLDKLIADWRANRYHLFLMQGERHDAGGHFAC